MLYIKRVSLMERSCLSPSFSLELSLWSEAVFHLHCHKNYLQKLNHQLPRSLQRGKNQCEIHQTAILVFYWLLSISKLGQQSIGFTIGILPVNIGASLITSNTVLNIGHCQGDLFNSPLYNFFKENSFYCKIIYI